MISSHILDTYEILTMKFDANLKQDKMKKKNNETDKNKVLKQKDPFVSSSWYQFVSSWFGIMICVIMIWYHDDTNSNNQKKNLFCPIFSFFMKSYNLTELKTKTFRDNRQQMKVIHWRTSTQWQPIAGMMSRGPYTHGFLLPLQLISLNMLRNVTREHVTSCLTEREWKTLLCQNGRSHLNTLYFDTWVV